MDVLVNIQAGFSAVIGLEPILLMILGTAIGIIVGATPGLSSGMAVAVLLPVTYTMSPLSGIIFSGLDLHLGHLWRGADCDPAQYAWCA